MLFYCIIELYDEVWASAGHEHGFIMKDYYFTKTIITIAQYTPNNVFCFFVVADTSASLGSTLQLIL